MNIAGDDIWAVLVAIALVAGGGEMFNRDVVGSNVVNIALIFGLALLIGPIHMRRAEFGRDYALALTAPLLTFWLARDGMVTRAEGAIGTTLPELVTTLLSRLRGHDNIGVGLLIGSNLFNVLAILGVAASIHPIAAPPAEIAVALGMGLLSLLLLMPGRQGILGRERGILLLGVYAAFVWATLTAGGAIE